MRLTRVLCHNDNVSICVIEILEVSDEDVSLVIDTKPPGMSTPDVQADMITLVTIIHLHLANPLALLGVLLANIEGVLWVLEPGIPVIDVDQRNCHISCIIVPVTLKIT